MRIEQEDDGKKGRFVLYENDKKAGEMTYSRMSDSQFIIDHTEVGEEFGGKGYGKALVMKAVEYARANNQKILPLCPYAKHVFDRNKDLEDVRF